MVVANQNFSHCQFPPPTILVSTKRGVDGGGGGRVLLRQFLNYEEIIDEQRYYGVIHKIEIDKDLGNIVSHVCGLLTATVPKVSVWF
jgi:hypothetical protein